MATQLRETLRSMLVVRAEAADQGRWNEYVDAQPVGCVYHQFEWGTVFQRAYGFAPVYLVAQKGRTVVGILPLIELSSPLFGRILSSMPYFGHGGMLADDAFVAEALATEAVRIARSRKARYIELRQLEEQELGWHERREKVNMVLPLPAAPGELFHNLKAKKRKKLQSQIRRPEKAGHLVRDGSHDLLHPFWLVYSENMRDLGSPCHSERLFGTILDVFGERARTVVVFDGQLPIAGGLVVGGQGTLEIPCASSLRSHNKTSPNMMLYGRVLGYACESGYERFNFGRSTYGEGTFRFKRQWGAEPHPIIYNVWVPPGSPPPSLKPDNPKFKAAVEGWKKLPVAVARIMGPPIVRGIP